LANALISSGVAPKPARSNRWAARSRFQSAWLMGLKSLVQLVGAASATELKKVANASAMQEGKLKPVVTMIWPHVSGKKVRKLITD